MVGSVRSYWVITMVVAAFLALAFLVKPSQAGFQFQTVPTAAPTGAAAEATATQAAVVQPTPAPAKSSTSQAATALPSPTSMSTEAGLAATLAGEPTSTPTAIVAQPTAVPPDPTGPGAASSADRSIQSVYWLIWGLGLLAGTGIIVFLAIRKANKASKPPTQGQPG